MPTTPKKYKLVWIVCLLAMLSGVSPTIWGLVASPLAPELIAGGVALAVLGFTVGWINKIALWWHHG